MLTRSGRTITISVLLTAVALAGCRPTVNSDIITNHGITYVFTGAEITQEKIDNADVLVQTSAYTFQNKGNYISLNGRRCGLVKIGDKVEVKEKGKVFINGIVR